MKLNELTRRNYTEQHRFYSDEVTEYEYISENSLTGEEFKTILETSKAYLFGTISFIKKQLTYSTGKDKSYTLLHIKEIKILLDNIETLISETINDCQTE